LEYETLEISGVSSNFQNVKPPLHNRIAPHWRFSGGGSVSNRSLFLLLWQRWFLRVTNKASFAAASFD